MKHTKSGLLQMQSLPLPQKVLMTERRATEWFQHYDGEVYVSFSGGKDSTVLSDICARIAKSLGYKLYLVFVDTGLEYPEIRKFVKWFAEYIKDKYAVEVVLDILRPSMSFVEVIKTHGYPLISKEVSKCVSAAKRLESKYGDVCRARLNGEYKQANGEDSAFNCAKYRPILDMDFNISDRCCEIMKKKPSHNYAKETGRKCITAQMASESRLREQQWIQHGCNGFDLENPVSNPMSFWTEQDVLQYIKQNELPIASVYGEIVCENNSSQISLFDGITEKLTTSGCLRTGCIFCGFGCHLEKSPTRFERLKETHPKQYEYCIGGGGYDENGVWKPTKQGLGMGHIFELCNQAYGEDFIKYK